MPPISVLMKPVSGMCNMFCDYCFYCDEMQKRVQESYGFMSEETLKNVIRKTILKAEGAITYGYQGGEPTLRGLEFFKKAVAFQNKYNKHNIIVNNAFQTNGYVIDDDWCKFFKENNFLIGISIDGTEAIHNSYRHSKDGKPTYEKVIEATRLMDKYGVDYNILTTVNQKVASNIKDIYKNYKTHGWRFQQYIPCLDPLGEVHGKREYSLKPEQYGLFLIQLFNLWYNDWKKGKQPFIRRFENYIAILLGYQPEACDQRGICGIQNVVEADGSVYPCDFFMLDEYFLGNFNRNQYEEIDAVRRSIKFIERSFNISNKCKACEYFYLCKGGCQRNRDKIDNTKLYHNYLCDGYKMFFAQCQKNIQEMADTIVKL